MIGGRPSGRLAHGRPLVLLACCAVLCIAGCARRFEAFRFMAADGRGMDLWQPARSQDLYKLGTPVSLPAGQAFFVAYQTSVPGGTVSIYTDRKSVLRTATLPPTSGNAVRLLVPLSQGTRVWGFRAGGVRLEGAGIAPAVHGFSIDHEILSVDGSVEVRSASKTAVEARLPPATRQEMGKGTWAITIDLGDPAQGGSVHFDSAGGRADFVVDAGSAPPSLAFGQASVGFLPAVIRVSGSVARLQISQVGSDVPIPSDPGLILAADPSLWRRGDYEVYSWTRFPTVLIFDTSTYDVQDDFFNRLAFYVEKTGFAGRIEDPSALRGIHGYNAHDYKADDLARFFSTAKEQGIALTPHETILLSILLAQGIVVETKAGGYGAGNGCVLSISHSSSPVLRSLLLTHESFHGVYFSLPTFRDATARAWSSLSPAEQDLWKEFLSSQKYDTANNYLVVNEFQAYLLQQERSAVPGRQALILSRMKAESSRGARLAAAVAAEAPDSFLRAFDTLDAALRAEGGPPGGLVIGVRPAGQQ